jgi:hypothetical protein
MKYFYLSIIALFLCHSAYAASIEDESLKSLPPDIEKSVHDYIANEDKESLILKHCNFVGMPISLGGQTQNYFVTAQGAGCHGNSAGPIWIVSDSEPPAVLAEAGGNYVEVSEQKHNGLNDLKISMGNAGHAIVEYWVFDGKQYIQDKKRRWYFPNCETQKDNSDNPFDCTTP